MTCSTRTRLFLSTLICFSLFSFTPAGAQDKPAAAKTEKKVELRKQHKVEAQVKSGPTGATKEWIDAENKLIDPLSTKDKETILILRNKHSYIQATKIVERDVGAAIKSCGSKNPDLKDKMDARYKQWKSAVDPILETAQKQLDKDIDALTIVDPDDMNDVLELHDEAYESAEKQVTKTPVTTKEACEGTLASMDRTEDNMIRLLQQTLLPESAIRKRAADAEKARPKKAVKATEKKTEPKAEAKPAADTKAE
jgi:hypothetical protein